MNAKAHLIFPERSAFMRLRTDRYVSKYVPIAYRSTNSEELDARHVARGLKIPLAAALQVAAPAMAALIDGPCWLVPVLASTGKLTANLALAEAIAQMVSHARVKCAVGRAFPVQSSCIRRICGFPGLTLAEHMIVRITGPIEPLPLYFVDNVITTGTTIAACRHALGWGIGLAYADASTRRKTITSLCLND